MNDFVVLVRQRYDIYAVVLYGSYAEGLANDDSDIEGAVFSDDFLKSPYEEMKELFRLRRQIDTDIEPLPFSLDAHFGSDSTEFVMRPRVRSPRLAAGDASKDNMVGSF